MNERVLRVWVSLCVYWTNFTLQGDFESNTVVWLHIFFFLLLLLFHFNECLNFAISYDFVQNLYISMYKYGIIFTSTKVCASHTHNLFAILIPTYRFACVSKYQVLTTCYEQRRRKKLISYMDQCKLYTVRICYNSNKRINMCGNPHCSVQFQQ